MHPKHTEKPTKKVKHHVAQWLISKEMTDHALRALRARTKLNRDFDIPYLAGYSKDGHTIYIDRHMAKSFVYKGRRVLTDRFLIMHEGVEKSLIQLYGLHYLHAHQIALHAEQAAVRGENIEWKAYDKFMQENIKTIEDERLEVVPADLDLTPYIDFHDTPLIKQMREKMVPVT
jgi:hypothetical protein